MQKSHPENGMIISGLGLSGMEVEATPLDRPSRPAGVRAEGEGSVVSELRWLPLTNLL